MSAAPIPQGVERFDPGREGCMDSSTCGEYVRYTDHAAALAASEARVAALIEEVSEAHRHGGRFVLRAEAAEQSLAEARKDAALTRELERAAKELPPGWTISVEVEAGAGWVELHDELGNFVSVDGEAFPLSDAVSDALDMAKGATS